MRDDEKENNKIARRCTLVKKINILLVDIIVVLAKH